MKLFAKYNRINLAAMLVIFLLAATAFYFSLRLVLIAQVDESLKAEKGEIVLYLSRYGKLPDPTTVKDQQIAYSPTNGDGEKKSIRNISMYDSVEKETDVFRQLVFSMRVKDQMYNITVSKSLEGTDDITKSVAAITIITILLILLATFILNRMILRKLWRPFYATIHDMRSFRLGQRNSIVLQATDIDEFNLLNTTLQQSINKAAQDYLSLKEFTENASHELQTPLAIIRSKLDLMIQDEHLTLQQSNATQAANDALLKLSKLNQSLLLLAKIGNHQFAKTSSIDLKKIVEEKIRQFSELWQHLKIEVSLESCFVNINEELAEILLNNLLGNATRHNTKAGNIGIHLSKNGLDIGNTATENAALDHTKIYQRFYKGKQSSENHGLGLSIVKQICDVSGYRIDYVFSEGMHHFIISF